MAAGRKLMADTDRKIAALAKDARNATAETKAAHEATMKELRQKAADDKAAAAVKK